MAKDYHLGRETSEVPPESAPILIVDDDRANLIALRSVLADLDQPVVCVQSGDDALRKVLDHDFAVILMDVVMPGMDGYATASLIRGRDRSRHIPIIFLSAMNTDRSQLFKGYSAGAVDYLFKPCEPLILRSKVSVFVDLHMKARELQRKARLEKQLVAENRQVRDMHSEAQLALERSRAQQMLVIEALPLALYMASSADAFQSRAYVGGNVQMMCGIKPKRFREHPGLWLENVHDDDRTMVLDALAKAQEGRERFAADYRWRCGDGSYRWFSDHGTVIPADSDGPAEMFGIWLDVTERRHLEDQLIHAHKIEAIGQLTGGIAHDFNNMLTVILGSLERADPASPDVEKTRRKIELALLAARNCSNLTRQLLGFARRQALEPKTISIRDQLERLQELLRRTLGANVKIDISKSESNWPVYVDPSQLESALVNLAINARDAMTDGGRLEIRMSDISVDEPSRLGLDIKAGDYVELSIADSGSGMAEEVRLRAFEPFFTTKEASKGTGLGLSTIYGFLKQSGGTARIESELGSGTRVHLYLPRAKSNGVPQAEPAADRRVAGLEGCRVLVVEDDLRVREVAVSMLHELGCIPVQAANGPEALAWLKTGEAVDILFTDCVMPGGLSGVQLAREATSLRQELPVLFTSANIKALDEGKELECRSRFLQKPYSSRQLADAMSGLVP